ncbi:MAG: carbon-nitrogen hydrolase family protein [Chloroflexi bacterium]|nr:carbon-nitrogen hydrolase family protein [Chloroflexota bacterium]
MIPKRYEKYEKVVTVACVNFATTWGNKATNLARMKAHIESAVAVGSNIIVFPELALNGYECGEESKRDGRSCTMHHETAEPVPGPATDAIAGLARQHGVYIVFGMAERDKANPDVHYISAPVVGPEGLIGVYRKLNLGTPPLNTESICFQRGNELPVFETEYGPIGVQVCYDFWRMPEQSRLLALEGARLIINPTASTAGDGKIEFMTLLTKSRATENHIYCASANLVGKERTFSYYGYSTIAGPVFPRTMPVFAQAAETEGIVTAALNFESLHRMDEINQWKKSYRRELISGEFARLKLEQG